MIILQGDIKQMKFRYALLFILVSPTFSCKKVPETIADGEWNYNLLVNGVRAGNAVITNSTGPDRFISKTAMHIAIGTIKNSMVQTVTETRDFRPLQLEISNTIEDTATGSRQT